MGFDHARYPSTIDLGVIRLCFQVFLEDVPGSGNFTRALEPVVSDPIYDKKSKSSLSIVRISHCSGSCKGGEEVVLLCEKVTQLEIPNNKQYSISNQKIF